MQSYKYIDLGCGQLAGTGSTQVVISRVGLTASIIPKSLQFCTSEADEVINADCRACTDIHTVVFW